MINLLPPENQRQLRAARVNVLLVRYVILSLAAVGLLAVAIAASYVILTMGKATAEDIIADSNRKASAYQSVDQEAQNFKNDLQTAKAILDKEVRYSKVIVDIAQTLPPNVILESLALDASTFGTPTTLSAKAKSYEDALTLKSNLQESSMFSDVHLQSVSDAADGGGDSGSDYPVTISINVTINKEVAQ